MTETHHDPQLKESALEWFFGLNDVERMELKEKYFPDTLIQFDSKWGYHFTFGQIEEMYIKSTPTEGNEK